LTNFIFFKQRTFSLPFVLSETRSITEPAGALALAGVKRYILDNNLVGAQKRFVAVVSGANMNFDRLRFVAERAELGEGREALLSVDIPERPGRYAIHVTTLNPALIIIQLYHFTLCDPPSGSYRIHISIQRLR
jgi:threonine dehydratase